MYPNFYYIFRDWFGWELNGLKLVNTFGFFVAVSFLLASLFMNKELKRKFREGILGEGRLMKYWVGRPATSSEYVTSLITGFILGYKFLPLVFDFSLANNDPQAYILSGQGSFLWGLICAGLFAGIAYWQDKKHRLPTPEEHTRLVDPSSYMGEFTLAAFIGGLIGAKLFHILENLSEFRANPMDSIVSFSGLTFYGGLIVGGGAVLYMARKRGIPILHMLDVGGPAMMLAYGVGRIGCQVSGDGDWGIVNTAPKPGWMSFLPDWCWSYDYPHNVNNVGVPIPGCFDSHCMHLVPPVFPTPFYETLMSLLLFFILWKLRKKVRYAGVIFAIYMIFNGIERFLIEQIRVNTIIDFLGMHVTQAEIISVCMIIFGLLLLVFAIKRKIPALKVAKTGTTVD